MRRLNAGPDGGGGCRLGVTFCSGFAALLRCLPGSTAAVAAVGSTAARRDHPASLSGAARPRPDGRSRRPGIALQDRRLDEPLARITRFVSAANSLRIYRRTGPSAAFGGYAIVSGKPLSAIEPAEAVGILGDQPVNSDVDKRLPVSPRRVRRLSQVLPPGNTVLAGRRTTSAARRCRRVPLSPLHVPFVALRLLH